MPRQDDGSVLFEGARIIFRNFSGKEGQYNREGDRNFSILLNTDVAQMMLADGWNVKALKKRDPDDEQQWHLPVSVGFKIRPPRMALITTKGRTPLNEEECEVLDWVDIKTVDVIIRPYYWNVRDASGIKAYLQTIFVIVNEDYLELKYSDLQDLSQLPARAGGYDSGGVIEGEIVSEYEQKAIGR